ncbi:F-box domain-containing protein, partial [Colletotrichum tofieldiae]
DKTSDPKLRPHSVIDCKPPAIIHQPSGHTHAWRFAGPLVYSNSAVPPAKTFQEHAHALKNMRAKRQVYCRKCEISRCRLHHHLQEWIGPSLNHYSIIQKYGPNLLRKSPALAMSSSQSTRTAVVGICLNKIGTM